MFQEAQDTGSLNLSRDMIKCTSSCQNRIPKYSSIYIEIVILFHLITTDMAQRLFQMLGMWNDSQYEKLQGL